MSTFIPTFSPSLPPSSSNYIPMPLQHHVTASLPMSNFDPKMDSFVGSTFVMAGSTFFIVCTNLNSKLLRQKSCMVTWLNSVHIIIQYLSMFLTMRTQLNLAGDMKAFVEFYLENELRRLFYIHTGLFHSFILALRTFRGKELVKCFLAISIWYILTSNFVGKWDQSFVINVFHLSSHSYLFPSHEAVKQGNMTF